MLGVAVHHEGAVVVAAGVKAGAAVWVCEGMWRVACGVVCGVWYVVYGVLCGLDCRLCCGLFG